MTGDLCPYDLAAEARPETRARTAGIRKVFLVTLGFNILVAVAKAVYGAVSGSVTVSADAFHSGLDGASNVLALVGLHYGAAPADAGHPYGHRKFEILAALGIAVLVGFSLFEIAGQVWRALVGQRPPPDIGWAGFAVVLGTLAVNAGVTRYERREGERLGSPLLLADAHHTRSDMYASTAVLLSFMGARAGLRWADGVGGVIIVIMVGRVAWDIFRQNIPFLVDAAVLDPARVQALGASVGGVIGIHHVRSRGTRWAMELDLHMEVEPSMPVEEAHRLAHRLEEKLRASLPHITDVVVHIEPARKHHGLDSREPRIQPTEESVANAGENP